MQRARPEEALLWGRSIAPMAKLGLTGAAGFIGGRVALLARDQGWELFGIDDFTGPVSGPIEGIPVQRGSYFSAEALRELGTCDVVLHLAAVSGVVTCAQDPAGSQEVNIRGFQRLADRCEAREIPIAFASSLAVVGSPGQLPITERTPPGPTHEYARQKAAGEEIVRRLRDRGVTAVAVRMSNVYGGYRTGNRMVAKGNVLNAFSRQAAGGILRVNAPGTQRRDFIHLEDVAQAWLRLADRLRQRAAFELPTLLFARGRTYSILEVARLVAETYGRVAPEKPALRVDVVTNPRGAIELLDEEFEVDPRETWRMLGVAPRHDVPTDLPGLLRGE